MTCHVVHDCRVALQTGTHLSESDGDTVMPTPAELADSNSSTDASTYYGCFIGHNAVAEGVQVGPAESA